MNCSSLYIENKPTTFLGRVTNCASVGLYEAAIKHKSVFLTFDQNAPLVS